MKRQAKAINRKQSERQMLLSAGLVVSAIGSNLWLMAGAQSQDFCLPPEVIPANSAVNYTGNTGSGLAPMFLDAAAPVRHQLDASQPLSFAPTQASPLQQVPGIVPVSQTAPPAMQSAQEARQSIFNSLMGTNVYPQFNGQNSGFNNQAGNMAGIPDAGQGGPQTLCNSPQTLSNGPLPQSNLVSPNQYNSNTTGSYPSQTQTLTGASNTPTTSQPRTSGGIGKVFGLGLGLAQTGVSLANGGVGNTYSAGILGGSLVNYGMHSGFSF